MILPDRTSYIGPKVKDGEMKICQVDECIGIEEKLDVYQFVLQSLASIERVTRLLKSGKNFTRGQMLAYGNGILNLQAVINSKKQLFQQGLKGDY